MKHPIINSVQRKLKHYEGVKVRPAKHQINLDVDEIEWLLKQAKKQTISEETIEILGESVKDLLEENKRFRKTLEFYANETNYEREYHGESTVEIDCGYRAQQILEELK